MSHLRILTLSIIAMLVAGVSPGAPAVARIEPPAILNVPGARSADPALASDGGARVGCAWVSKHQDRLNLVFREYQGESWSEMQTISGSDGVTPAQPILLYDNQSQPHLIWRETDIAGTERLMHASRQSGFWMMHGPLAAGGSQRMADPSAGFSPSGRLHVAWRQGRGSFWSIRTADVETSGTVTLHTLAPAQSPRLLYPTIISQPQPRLYWFSEDAGRFRLELRERNEIAGTWDKVALPMLEDLPVNRLPLLFGSEAGATCGVWVDAWQGMERIFWGISGEETSGAGTLVDEPETVPGSQPIACWSSDGPVVAWRGETPDGSVILVRQQTAEGWTPPVAFDAPYASEPRLAALGATAWFTWISSASDGGDGNLYAGSVHWGP